MKSLAVVLTLVVTTLCARGNLAIGDAAPALSVKEWIKGGPVDMAAGKGKNIYVIEFWATWHEPCRQAIPHMTELQKRYKDRGVVFMGLTDEAPSLVKSFVQRMGEKMDYAVAIDEHDKVFESYMKPFDQDGIPHAFLVDKEGRLVWHGYPVGSLDKALDDLISGKFNLEEARKHDRVTKMQVQYIDLVNAPATRNRAAELGDNIITDLGRNVGGLNSFAWRILTDRRVKHRDPALALKAAKLAYDLGGSKEPSVVDTYARALFESGQREAAIEQQKAAIGLAKDEGQRIEFEGTLKKYRRLLRESAGH
jgi:thiol-disulfide isomerase/thioredoxin